MSGHVFTEEQKEGRVLLASWEEICDYVGMEYVKESDSSILCMCFGECRTLHAYSMRLDAVTGKFECPVCGYTGDKIDFLSMLISWWNLSQIIALAGISPHPASYFASH